MEIDIVIHREGLELLPEYESIPCVFEVRSRLNLDALARGEFVEIPCESHPKNFDAFEDQRPTALPGRYNLSEWGILSCRVDGKLLGGILVAPNNREYVIPGSSHSTAILVDIRVHPDARRHGIGTALFISAISWATTLECTEILVETQDTNVSANRFYAQMGFQLKSVEPMAYAPLTDEARLIWSIRLIEH